MTTLEDKKAKLAGGGNSRPFLNQNTTLLGALEIATGAANANRPYELNLNEIIVDAAIQVRVGGLDNDTLEAYVAVLENGGELPPIIVFRDDSGEHYLADGFHRYAAHEQVGKAIIKAFVKDGNRDQALDFAEGANLEHGLKLSNEDKKNILFRRLARKGHPWLTLSNGQLAQALGVSAMSVGRWVKEFTTITNVIVERSEIKGADGRIINTGNIGRPVAAPQTTPKPLSPGVAVGSHTWINWVYDNLEEGRMPDVPAPYEIQPRSGEGTPMYLFWAADDDGKLFPVHRPMKAQATPSPSPQAGKGDMPTDLPEGYSIKKIDKGGDAYIPQTPELQAIAQEAVVRLNIQRINEAIDDLLQTPRIETLVTKSEPVKLKGLIAVMISAITREYSLCQQILAGLGHDDLLEVEGMLARLNAPIDGLANAVKNRMAEL